MWLSGRVLVYMQKVLGLVPNTTIKKEKEKTGKEETKPCQYTSLFTILSALQMDFLISTWLKIKVLRFLTIQIVCQQWLTNLIF